MKIKVKFSELYYTCAVIGYILTLFFTGFRPGVFGAAIIILTTLQVLLSEFANVSEKSKLAGAIISNVSLLDAVVALYFVYNLISFIWLTKYGYPFSIYAEEFVASILPIVFYFIAISKNNNKTEWYKKFLYAVILLGVVSILLYAIAPQFYCDYLFRWNYISKADASTARVRMESITGSTVLSYLGVAAMAISSFFMFDKKVMASKNKILPYIMFVFSLVLVFMANGRAGMVAALLVIVYLNYIIIFKLKLISKKFFYVEAGVVLVCIAIMCIVTPGIVAKFSARLVSLPGAVGQRSEQWIAAANNMKGAWLGNGLGANGHKALPIEGAHVVADGGLVKLFCEEGCFGFGLFVYIMLVLCIKSIKNLEDNYAELAVIATAILMSIGSNIIAFQLCMPVFWYAAGIISSNTRVQSDSLKCAFQNRKNMPEINEGGAN